MAMLDFLSEAFRRAYRTFECVSMTVCEKCASDICRQSVSPICDTSAKLNGQEFFFIALNTTNTDVNMCVEHISYFVYNR